MRCTNILLLMLQKFHRIHKFIQQMTLYSGISYGTLDKSLPTVGFGIFICKGGQIVWFLISTSCLAFSKSYEMY